MILSLIISAIISYLLGSLNFGIIISKSLNKDDVRSHGSGNAGSTNMLRNYGKKYAVMTIIGDMLNGCCCNFYIVYNSKKIRQHFSC